MTASRSRSELNDILGSRKIDHVVVLGANGAMGYGSGALFTTVVPKVTFLARTKEKADQGLKAAINQVRSSTVASRVETGDYDKDFDAAVGKADRVRPERGGVERFAEVLVGHDCILGNQVLVSSEGIPRQEGSPSRALSRILSGSVHPVSSWISRQRSSTFPNHGPGAYPRATRCRPRTASAGGSSSTASSLARRRNSSPAGKLRASASGVLRPKWSAVATRWSIDIVVPAASSFRASRR